MNITIHQKLSHLSKESLFHLIQRYYDGDKVRDLIQEYSLDIAAGRSGELVSCFPPKVLDEKCPYCGGEFHEKRPSKAALAQRWGGSLKRGHLPQCQQCGHIAIDLFSYPEKISWIDEKDLNPCECVYCTEIKRENALACIEEFNLSQTKQIEFHDINLDHIFMLASFCSGAALHDGALVLTGFKRLSPDEHSDEVWIKTLLKLGILKISNKTRLSAFSYNSDNEVESITLKECSYSPNINYNNVETLKEECLEEINKRFDPSVVYSIYRDMWAIEEFKAYYWLKHFKWVYTYQNPPQKRLEAFKFLADNFGIGEGIYLISHSFKRCQTGLKNGEFTNRAHAVNTVPHNILKLGKWLIRKEKETSTDKLPIETNNCLRSVFCELLGLAAESLNRCITEESLTYFKAVGGIGNPICNIVGMSGRKCQHPEISTFDYGDLAKIMQTMCWSLEMVSEFIGIDLERLFQITNNKAIPTKDEEKLFKVLGDLAKAKMRATSG